MSASQIPVTSQGQAPTKHLSMEEERPLKTSASKQEAAEYGGEKKEETQTKTFIEVVGEMVDVALNAAERALDIGIAKEDTPQGGEEQRPSTEAAERDSPALF